MSLFWKKYTIIFELPTMDKQWFRFATVEFEQKRNWYWLICKNILLHRCILDCIKEYFQTCINLNYIYEGENPNRLIDDEKLEWINSKINLKWNNEYQKSLKSKIRNIRLTYLIR